ncbi:MAG: sulfatase-like hydrolase/transferase [Firmicutes bacterium]|nr:sulfatase-like hydrolase/transferase [Bacillota bacterium]
MQMSMQPIYTRDEPPTLQKKALDAVLTCVCLLAFGLFLGFVSLYFGAFHFSETMFPSYFAVDKLVFLNVVPAVYLVFLLYFAIGRIRWCFAISFIIMFLLTWANHLKLLFRNDPLLVGDILRFFESLDMAGNYGFDVRWELLLFFVVAIAAFIWVKKIVKKKADIRVRIVGLIVCLVLGYVSFQNIYLDQNLYDSLKNEEEINTWSASEVYVSKGFLYPFLHSVSTSLDRPPEGYDEEAAEAYLAQYDYDDIPEKEKVNVIAIMMESYNDLSKFEELELNIDVYRYLHRIQEESYCGELVTNIFAGNTIDTERSFLTGHTDLINYRSPVNTYVQYFREQGYVTEGSHPYHDWFYNRKNINEYMGFDNYYFYENYYKDFSEELKVPDEILFPQIIELYEANKETGKPYFSFNVTYQNHGPYPLDEPTELPYAVNDGYTDEEYNILNNYLMGIESTTIQINELINYFREESEPVVVILFGDHNPWLGDNNIVYEAMGMNLELSTQDGFYNYYNTPYIIWGNDSAKAALNNDLQGEGPSIGPYFLMNQFFELVDWEGNEFMKMGNDLRKTIDVVHSTGAFRSRGWVVEELSPLDYEIWKPFEDAQYYWRTHFVKDRG